MKNRFIFTTFILLFTVTAFGQVGLRGGINTASEIHSFSQNDISAAFQGENLTGYQVGLVYQFNPKRSGLGFEIGALLSQKGSVFRMDSASIVQSLIKGYHEINYVEVPINLRLRLSFGGIIGVFGSAGVYGAYALRGKTVFESDIATLIQEESFDSFMNRIDYGYSYGGGVELLKKIQLGFQWSQGLQKRDANKNILDKITTESGGLAPNLTAKSSSKVFSVSLTYLF